MQYKKIKFDEYIRIVAKGKGISVKECRREMEFAIKEASENASPLFIKLFGNRTPDLEEFIYALLDTIKKKS